MKPKPVHEKVIAVKIPADLDRRIEKFASSRDLLKREVIIGFLKMGLAANNA